MSLCLSPTNINKITVPQVHGSETFQRYLGYEGETHMKVLVPLEQNLREPLSLLNMWEHRDDSHLEDRWTVCC